MDQGVKLGVHRYTIWVDTDRDGGYDHVAGSINHRDVSTIKICYIDTIGHRVHRYTLWVGANGDGGYNSVTGPVNHRDGNTIIICHIDMIGHRVHRYTGWATADRNGGHDHVAGPVKSKGGNYLIISPQLDLVVEVMKPFPYPWFIAGGWALDLDFGEQTREHEDVDLCCFRKDLNELLDFFSDWDRQVAIPEDQRLVPCEKEEDALSPKHELHFSKDNKKIEILLIDRDGPYVLFRRDPSIRLSIEEFKRTDVIGRPFVSPSWQLLFKAKNPRPKDNDDFLKHAPALSKKEKLWLLSTLRIHQPTSLWIIKLEKLLSQGS